MGQDLGAVDTPPHHGVVGDLVDLVPGQLGGHKVVDAALLHDLGQGAGVAEHVRQPQDAVVHAELVLEKPLAVDELAHQGLAGGQVAVGFQPHAALGLPASLLDPLLDPLIEGGIALLQEVVQHRLAGHKPVAGELLHELEYGGKAPGHLLTGLGHGPPPGNIDVGMTDAGGDDIVPAAQLLVEILRNVGLSRPEGGVEALGIGLPQIQEIDGLIEGCLNGQPLLTVLLHPGERPEGDLDIPVQPVDLLVLLIEFHQELKLRVESAGVRLDIQLKLFPGRRLGEELHLPVVHVQPLRLPAVDEEEELGILAIVPLLNLSADLQPDGLARQVLGNGQAAPEPVMLIGTVPVHRLPVEGLPGVSLHLRLGGVEEKALLVLPVRDGPDIANAEFVEVVADDLDPFVNEIHNFVAPK